MAQLILLNKPYNVLSQFTDQVGRRTLAELVDLPGVYPAGRLDRDSEGLLLLTDSGPLAHRLTDPRKRTWKTYWVQVEGTPTERHLAELRSGLELKDGPTLPAKARLIEPPGIWPRDPPVRHRAKIPTRWIELAIREGRNRQVRRMTAAIGLPTLRLIRWRVGDWSIDGLTPGEWRRIEVDTPGPATPRKTRRSRPRRAAKVRK